ncbi:MAG: DHH family phosphoesterase [Lachnospiraceae bacterium]|nr:DHH family phosphoesterase [Lachnospiraceae bacterium]
MSIKLSRLLAFNNIVIQCHDNPDADALASGFALWRYLAGQGVRARLVYGGRALLTKCNLLSMVERLEIPVEYVTELAPPELLLTVDCQYGESNVTHFEAEHIAVIDHHQLSTTLPALSELRSNYGSCSSVIFKLLENEGFEINDDPDVATALFYGLYTDTGGLAEISHPADRDLRDHARYSKEDILYFRNSNLSREELAIAGEALENAIYEEGFPYAMIESKPCDPNLLGVISDMLLEVEGLESCLVYSILPFGVKLSVRSCSKDVKANELADFLTEGLGGGGGHTTKAGGILKKDLFAMRGRTFSPGAIREFLRGRMHRYYSESIIRYAGVEDEDITGFKHYMKKDVKQGYVEARYLSEYGKKVLIRTLEGDVEVEVEDDVLIILGVDGEIYPCRREKFERSYKTSDDPYIYPGEYVPAVINTETGERIELLPYAKSCVALGGSWIYAKELDHRLKLFTTWDTDSYYLGVKGDYLAVRPDDHKDIYIIARRIFDKTYEEVEG